jgi:D-arabinose 1-dehydrogenase-like Zn-dependent alcohol dehydrogenase
MTGATVLAAVVHEFKAPLQLEEVPVPEAGLGEVLVRVEAAGLCPPTSMPPMVTGRSSPSCR